MGAIIVNDSRRIEYKDLEAHVNISHERYRLLEERIQRVDGKLEKIQEEQRASRKIVIGAMLSIVTSLVVLFLPRLMILLAQGKS